MKRLVLVLGMLLFFTFGYAQMELAQVNYNKYESVEVLSDELTQVGYFKIENGIMVRHGIWKLIRNGEVVKRVYYQNNELQWIECKINGKFTRDQLLIERLKRENERLKEQIVSLD